MTGGGLLLTISEHIMIGETISHDAKAILRGVRHPFIWKKGLWYGITTSCGKDVIMYILSSREMRQKFYQNNDFHGYFLFELIHVFSLRHDIPGDAGISLWYSSAESKVDGVV